MKTIRYNSGAHEILKNSNIPYTLLTRGKSPYRILSTNLMGHNNIVAAIKTSANSENVYLYPEYGYSVSLGDENANDLMIEIDINNGDYLQVKDENDDCYIIIIDKIDDDLQTFACHAIYNPHDLSCIVNTEQHISAISVRIAVPEHVVKMNSTLMEMGYKFNRKTTMVDEIKESNHEFKTWDRVLVRDSDVERWETAIFSRMIGDKYVMMFGSFWNQCIPYNGNEHLNGCTNKTI